MHASVLGIGINDPARMFLSDAGFQVFSAKVPSADAVCDLVFDTSPEAVIFGSDSPHGSDAVAIMRRRHMVVPVIRIEPGPRSYDWSRRCIEFLDAGGDDVIEDSSRPEVIAAVLRAKIKSARIDEVPVFRFEIGDDSLEINMRSKRVLLNEVSIHLTRSELQLLILLAETRGIVTRRMMDEYLYGINGERLHNCVEVFIVRLRQKLGPLSVLVRTRRGLGYELCEHVN